MLSLGKKQFSSNLIQGPLAGVSCAPFRYLTWKYSQPAFTCTEMISCKTLIHQAAATQKRYVEKHPHEGPVCFQLAGSDPQELAEAVKRATDLGAELIDLNCGCPVKKIRSKGAGSRLLTDASKLYSLMVAMKQNTHVPVSIKIRVEHPTEKFNREIANTVSDAGVDFLIVHGRHWTQHYETPCRLDEIAFFVNELKIPVIGNGDVACVDSLKAMLRTGCAGVMISRAGVGQPWLIKNLHAELQGENSVLPSSSEIGEILREHVTQLAVLLENEKAAVLQARKFAKYYARRLENKMEFCAQIQKCESLLDFNEVCLRFFL